MYSGILRAAIPLQCPALLQGQGLLSNFQVWTSLQWNELGRTSWTGTVAQYAACGLATARFRVQSTCDGWYMCADAKGCMVVPRKGLFSIFRAFIWITDLTSGILVYPEMFSFFYIGTSYLKFVAHIMFSRHSKWLEGEFVVILWLWAGQQTS